MKQEDKKKQDYKIRHQFWQNKALEQFGNANNFFLGINILVFGYFIREAKGIGLKLSLCGNEWECKETLLGFTIFLAFISLLSGCITILSRLYDLRITRHINDIRNKDYTDYNKIIYKNYRKRKDCIRTKIERYSLSENFFKTVFGKRKKYWIENLEVDAKTLLNKFHCLRTRANKLGEFSWIAFKWQILWLLFSLFLYFINTFVIP